MVKYRIQKTISHKYLGNICDEICRYKIQYKNFLFWKDYVYKTSYCNTSDYLEPVYEDSNVYFDTEEKAISAINKIKNLYKEIYKGYLIFQTYDERYTCVDFFNTYKTLQNVKDIIDTNTSKDKISYIKV